MRIVGISRAILYFADHNDFSEAALSANEDTVALAPPFREATAQADAMLAKERAVHREVIRAQALLSVKDVTLDCDTTTFGAAALIQANLDRASTDFRRYFPAAPSLLIRWPLRKQCEHTLNTMVPALAKVADTSPLKPFGPLLQKRAEQAVAALEARGKAKAAQAVVAIEIEEWKEGINRLRLGTYAELLSIAAEKGYPRTWANAFFMSDTSSDDTSTDDAEPLATPPTTLTK